MIGTCLNNYEIISLLGEGGMGRVFLARHTFMGRRVAVKVLRPELLQDKALVARFMAEARATNATEHPNIIDIIDVGFLPGTQTPYLMMEYLDGESLAQRLQSGRRVSMLEAVEIACQTASALEAAHRCQIIHRDLKPENLFLVRDEARPFLNAVKVLDFGIAKLRCDLRAGTSHTKTNMLMGTPFYMSPEQCRGQAAGLNHQSDIYSLGVIVYEMLCGRLPFHSEAVVEVLSRHMTEAPASMRTHVPTMPESLDRVVLRAMAKQPADRFESMTAFARALREAAGMPMAPVGMDHTLPADPSAPVRIEARTTLSSMADQLRAEPGSRPRRKGLRGVAIFLGISAAATAAVWALAGRPRTPEPPSSATAGPVIPAAPATPPVVHPPATPSVAQPETEMPPVAPAGKPAPGPAPIQEKTPSAGPSASVDSDKPMVRGAVEGSPAKRRSPRLEGTRRGKDDSVVKQVQGDEVQQPPSIVLPLPPSPSSPLPPPIPQPKPVENGIRPGDRW